MRLLALVYAVMFAVMPARADDGAASIAAGGIVLMKREPRIVMAKEVLDISERAVDVTYEFRNDSDVNISTEVAFPIPEYGFCCGEQDPTEQGFDDFKLWVHGQPTLFKTEVRASLDGRDITTQLRSMDIDVATFGHYSEQSELSSDLVKLTPAQTRRLQTEGLIKIEGQHEVPLWDVRKKYHWRQIFPAHAIIQIHHRYTPWLGNSNSVESEWLHTGRRPSEADELPSVCPSPSLLRALRNGPMTSIAYVDFVLTTANTWKQPIEDFTLNVHRDSTADFVSFCWSGPVEKTDGQDFTAHRINFVPKTELRIGFLKRYKMD